MTAARLIKIGDLLSRHQGWLAIHAPVQVRRFLNPAISAASSPQNTQCCSDEEPTSKVGGAPRAATLRALYSSATALSLSPKFRSINSNALACNYLTEPTLPTATNAQYVEFGTKRPWVRIPPPRLKRTGSRLTEVLPRRERACLRVTRRARTYNYARWRHGRSFAGRCGPTPPPTASRQMRSRRLLASLRRRSSFSKDD